MTDKLPNFTPHDDKKLHDELLPPLKKVQQLATKHNVPDIFQDNGGKLLELALVTGLTLLESREGNDAKDETGMEYEIKTLNYTKNKRPPSGFTTHHHLNPTIINKYRKVHWIFAIYFGIELSEIYFLYANQLEPLFAKWEAEWNATGKDKNNPKIPVPFVKEHGIRIYPQTESTE